MKRAGWLVLATFWLAGGWFWSPRVDPNKPNVEIGEIQVTATATEENATFETAFEAQVNRAPHRVLLVKGPVAYVDSTLPPGSELSREGDAYYLTFKRTGRQAVRFGFAGRVARDQDWRQTGFSLSADATVRKLVFNCDRPDMDVRFTGALNVAREKDAAGNAVYAAFLSAGAPFAVQWKPQVRKLDADLAVSCDANTIATARVGALQLNSRLTYRVVQGSLQRLSLALPAGLNVTQVRGEDLREWNLENDPSGERVLTVALSRPKDKVYSLVVESELVLPSFPCTFNFPLLAPRDVIRASGFLMIGADSAIKLLVGKAAGLTQIDQSAFPADSADGEKRARPGRSVYAYQYANLPFEMQISADDIVTALHSEERLVLSIDDVDLGLDANLDLEVRDAPARDVVLLTDPRWIVANVEGQNVSDYDVQDHNGERQVHVYFREAVLGHTLLNVRLEHSLKEGEEAFDAPAFRVQDGKTSRGYIILRAEAGVRLEPGEARELREVPIGSLPVRVNGAQFAYRFKSDDWSLPIRLRQEAPSIHAELFHLASLGEGMLYGSCSVTYNIGNAPVRTFRLHIPTAYQNVEITGRDIRGWQQDGETWTVSLQEKVSGDYTLLITYSQPVAYEGDQLLLGGIRALGTESEVGYLALAGAPTLAFGEEVERDPSILPITPEELPREYTLLVRDPILRAYKYVAPPHEATVTVRRYDTQPLLEQVADHMSLATRLSKEGEAVTEIAYFVKNTSGQYLGVRVPAGAKLWSATVDGETVNALEDGKGMVLVPVPRHRDPNQPSKVQLVYAEKQRALGWLRRPRFTAPGTVARSVFARWTFTVPDRYRIRAASGNMMAQAQNRAGLLSVARPLVDFWRAFFRRGWGWIAMFIVLAAAAAFIARQAGRGRPLGWVNWVVLLAAVFLVLVLGHLPLPYDFWHGLSWNGGSFPGPRWDLTKPVTLSEAPLQVVLTVVPRWSIYAAAALRVLAGIVIAVWLWRRGRARPGHGLAHLALALTAFTWGLAGLPHVGPVWALLLMLAVPVALVVGFVRRAWRAGCRRRAETPPAPPAPPAPSSSDVPPPPPPPPPADEGPAPEPVPDAPSFASRIPEGEEPEPQAGFARPALLGVLALAALLGAALPAARAADKAQAVAAAKVAAARAAAAAKVAAETPPAPPMVMDNVTLEVVAPDLPEAPIRNARVTMRLRFKADRGREMLALPGPYVLTGVTQPAESLKVVPTPCGVRLRALRGGKHEITLEYLAAVTDASGAWQVRLWLPPNVRNLVTLAVPRTGWEVTSPDAVYLAKTEAAGKTSAELRMGPSDTALVSWQPSERKVGLEQTVFFCDVNTFVLFQPGLVNLTHLIRYQIAQGELQSLSMSVPDGMSVTAVNGAGLSTWRFDPQKRTLEALLEKPVSGEYVLTVVEQVPRESLPYKVDLAEPVVKDAVRQRGSMAFASTDAVQINVGEIKGLSGMNVGDFSPEAVQAALRGGRQQAPETRRAFRYHQLPVAAKVEADRVLPEIRVSEKASVDVTDERIVLSSALQLAISKAGVFSVRLDVPADFDVDSLTGNDVSHWDEVKDDGRGILVHFTKQALGDRTLNLVLSRLERTLPPEIVVPRVTVRDALKHTGTLAVSGERGLRFTTLSREGVSEINPRELGIEQPGYLAFRLLRPDWSVTLKTEALAPVVKADLLQRVDLSEGMQHIHGFVRYEIEHAGVKSFQLKAPAPGVALTVTGKHIARVQEVDAAQGLWEIELQNKVERDYQLEVTCQLPFDHGTNDVSFVPMQTVGADSQKGYLVVFAGGRLRVQPVETPAGLHAEDPRSIPALFGAGDLSGAIVCYRTTRPDYALALSVQRHESAETLPARVRSVELVSVVSDDDQMITQGQVELDAGTLRFLEMRLPEGSEVWSLFVNGRAVLPLLAKGTYLIPLQAGGDGHAAVEFIYGDRNGAAGRGPRHAYDGPRFNLPLSDVQWTFYLPPRYRYYGFGGTLQPEEGAEEGEVVTFSVAQYDRDNKKNAEMSLRKAEQVLEQGAQLWQQGKPMEARQALEEAIAYSQSREDLNEDARIQYRNLVRQQAVVGLANRRSALKVARNVADEQSVEQLRAFNDGNFDADYGRQVEQSLGAKESDNLNAVAEKLLDQQDAAEAEVHPIRITLPVQGRRMVFFRELQIQPDAEMKVTFKATSGRLAQGALAGAAAVGLVILFALLLRVVKP